MKRIVLLTVILLLAVSVASAQTLTQAERDRASKHLEGTRKMFLDATAGLTPEQWEFKPAPERWSLAECAEHIAVSEDFIMQLIKERILPAPATPEQKEAAKGKDDQVLRMIPDRSQKFQAPEMLQPTRRFATTDELVKHFKESRGRSLEYVKTSQDDLRGHFFDHPVMKTLDAYQWVLLMSAHTERHVKQMLEVKEDPNFPKK